MPALKGALFGPVLPLLRNRTEGLTTPEKAGCLRGFDLTIFSSYDHVSLYGG